MSAAEIKQVGQMYVERKIDHLLWDSFMEWWGDPGRRVGSISLESEPGRGNTHLLEHFRNRVQQHRFLGKEVLMLLADADANAINEDEDQGLPPIAGKVFSLHSQTPEPWSRHIRGWLTGHLLVRFVAMSAGVFLALSFGAFVHETGWPPQVFSAKFWIDLIGGAQRHSLDIARDLVEALLFAFVVELVKWGLEKKTERENKRKEEEERQLEGYRNNGPGLISGIRDLCHRRSGLFLIVDNAHALKPSDRILVERLTSREVAGRFPGVEEIRRLRADVRVFVLTLDLPRHPPLGSTGECKVLAVNPFTRIELRQIIDHSTQSGEQTKSGDWLIDLAEQNVKAVFLEAKQKQCDVLVHQFEEACEAGIEGIFGHSDLMALCAARPQLTQTKKELLDRVRSLELSAFNIENAQDTQKLIEEFCAERSLLVRVEGQVIHFDAAACKMLRDWIGEHEEAKPVLMRAHYFWLAELVRPFSLTTPPAGRSFSGAEQVAIRKAAWHARKLGFLVSPRGASSQDPNGQKTKRPDPERAPIDPEGVTKFLAGTRLDGDAQLKFRYQAAAALLLSSVFNRSEGEIDRTRILLRDAIAWLPLGTGAERRWLVFATRLLWSSYWILVDAGIREQLAELLVEYTLMGAEPSNLIHQQFEGLLKGNSKSAGPAPAEPTDADLRNIWDLTAVLGAVRRSHGFLSDGLSDSSIVIPDPQLAGDAPWAEYALRDLKTSALIARQDWAGAEQALDAIREVLRTSPGENEPIHMQVNHLYQSARYHHLLLEYRGGRSEALETLEQEEREKKLQELEGWLSERTISTLGKEGGAPHECIFEQARADYRSAMQIASLLGFHFLLLEVGFHHGRLLYRFTAEEVREEHSTWWNEWDHVFKGSLRVEKESGWQLYSPDIYRMNWEFFGEQDKSAAITDAFNTLQSARAAGFPDEVVLEWHERTGAVLNDYGQSREDRQRSAELHELWARSLAALPQAERHRTFKRCLPLEQAHELNFAAQAERHAVNLKRAEDLIEEASQLWREGSATEHGENPDAVRDLGIAIRMQRAWIEEAKPEPENGASYSRTVRDLWKDIDPDGLHAANVLGSLIVIEAKENILGDLWPSTAHSPVHADLDNPRFSLPEKWFEGSHPLVLGNRFQFRFYQLLKMAGDDYDRSAVAFQYLGALTRWNRHEHFGESVLAAAKIEVHGSYLSRTLAGSGAHNVHRARLEALLEGVTLVFGMDGDAENQISGYQTLMQMEPLLDRFRIGYVDALISHEKFLERDLRARALDRADWLSTARRLDYYFSKLVDQALLQKKVVEQIQHSGQTPEGFLSQLGELNKRVERARRFSAAGDDEKVLADLDPVLSFNAKSWVSLVELEALDLWLGSATRLAQARFIPQDVEKVNRRAAQLREMTLQYIAEFGLTIDDPRIQHLAIQLFETIRDAVPEAQSVAGYLPARIA